MNRCIELAKDAKDAETRLILFELAHGCLEPAAKLDKIKHSAEDAGNHGSRDFRRVVNLQHQDKTSAY